MQSAFVPFENILLVDFLISSQQSHLLISGTPFDPWGSIPTKWVSRHARIAARWHVVLHERHRQWHPSQPHTYSVNIWNKSLLDLAVTKSVAKNLAWSTSFDSIEYRVSLQRFPVRIRVMVMVPALSNVVISMGSFDGWESSWDRTWNPAFDLLLRWIFIAFCPVWRGLTWLDLFFFAHNLTLEAWIIGQATRYCFSRKLSEYRSLLRALAVLKSAVHSGWPREKWEPHQDIAKSRS